MAEKKRCIEIDKLVTPFVDDEVSPAERVAVDEHLGKCPPCLCHAQAERTVRHVVRDRADRLMSPAPEALRRRCGATAGRRRATRWPLAMAATLVLAVAGAFVYGTFVNPSVAVAAQLTFDHLKCFALFDGPAGMDPAEVRQSLRERFGWDLAIPETGQLEGLSLVGGRRCVYLEGSVAHLLYKQGAVPVSVFVLPGGSSLPGRHAEVLGYSAVSFERGGRTWVVLAHRTPDDVDRIAGYFGADAR